MEIELSPVCTGAVIGLDVHLKQVTAAAIVVDQEGQASSIVKGFNAFKEGLRRMAEWCVSLNPEVVVMESRGRCWVNPYRILSEHGITPMVVDARHVKQLKRKKSDTSDSLWLAKLARFGLLKPSSDLSPDFMDIRTHARLRQDMSSDLARAKNRIEEILSEAGIRLGAVVSDIHGVEARRILVCLIEGGTVEDALTSMGTRLEAATDEQKLALEGSLSGILRFTLRDALDHVRDLEIKIADRDLKLLKMLEPHKNDLDFLQTIPGLDRIASLAGLFPDDNKSTGKRKSGKTRKSYR